MPPPEFVRHARRAKFGPVFAADSFGDGAWRSGVPRLAELLDTHFSPESRFRTFPMLPAEPLSNVARAVAALLSPRLALAPERRDSSADESRRETRD